MSEYVRCGDDAPCSVASDLRARVQELEEQLDEIARSELAQVTARDAVVEAVGRWTDYTEGLLRTGMYELGDLGELVREVVLKVRALRATEGRG